MANHTHLWQAEKYSQNSQYQYRCFMKLIERYRFLGNESILDIGCGDGKISAEIADRVPHGHVMAVDSSSSMIDFAKHNHQRRNLVFKLCDAENLTSLNQSFDIIVSSFCLHWVENKQKAFHEIAMCLKPGGSFLMIMTHRNPITARIRDEMIKTSKWKNYFDDYVDVSARIEDSVYDQYSIVAGLKIDHYDLESVRVDFSSPGLLKNFFANLTPHLNRLPNEALKEKFMDQLIFEYLSVVPAEMNGAFHMNFTCINFIGHKPLIGLPN